MRLAPLALIPAVALILAACSSSGGAGTASPQPASAAPPSTEATRIEVTLTDALKIEPTAMTVPAGVPVTFAVTNAGTADHEFYIGDEDAQAEHEQEMSMGGMSHDDPDGIALKPGETKELTYTFAEPGETLAGCHVTGHYGGGMKATITVEG